MAKILYFFGGRGVTSDRLGGKPSEVINCWRRAGHTVDVVMADDIVKLGRRSGDSGGAKSFGDYEYHNRWYRKIKAMSFFANSAAEAKDLVYESIMLPILLNKIRKNRYDLVIERSTRLHALGVWASTILGVPYVLEWKDNLINYKFSLFRPLALTVEKIKVRKARFIIVESSYLVKLLREEDPALPEEKFKVALNAADPEKFKFSPEGREKIRKKLEISEDTVLIGYVGSYAFYHDTERLVLAAQILKQRALPPFKILMVGRGKDYQKTKALAEDLGLIDNTVIFHPPVPRGEVVEFLSACDVGVLPGSTDIICPIKIPEYMSVGIPPVLPDYPANREVVEHRKDGLLFRPKNEVSLADALTDLIKSEELRLELGKNAQRKQRESLVWEKTWGRALEEILAAL